MSITDLNNLSNHEVITHYILELRECGHVLPYEDYSLIKQWLEIADQDVDKLLLILSDILPSFFAKRKNNGHPPPLKTVHKSIIKKLSEFNGRTYYN